MGGSAAAQLAGDSPELAELGSIIGESITFNEIEGEFGKDENGDDNFTVHKDSESKYHRRKDGLNDNNIKITHGGSTEDDFRPYELVLRPTPGSKKIIYSDKHKIDIYESYTYVNDPNLKGTYNAGSNKFTHMVKDVIPYWYNGNEKGDTSTASERVFGP